MAKRGKVTKQKPREDVERPARHRKYTYHFLVVCEDENTEPYYFGKYVELFQEIWPRETVYLKAVGTGRNSLGVVKQAVIERERLKREAEKSVDQVWAVFDKDDLDLSKGNRENFEEAFEMGAREHVHIALSNECFELWLLLHYQEVDATTPIPRKELYGQLENAIQAIRGDEFQYAHGNREVVDEVWKSGDKTKAMERARQLEDYHLNARHSWLEANPCTLMHKLVKELDELREYYSYEP